MHLKASILLQNKMFSVRIKALGTEIKEPKQISEHTNVL